MIQALKYAYFFKENGESTWNDPSQWDTGAFVAFRQDKTNTFEFSSNCKSPSKQLPGPSGIDEEKALLK